MPWIPRGEETFLLHSEEPPSDVWYSPGTTAVESDGWFVARQPLHKSECRGFDTPLSNPPEHLDWLFCWSKHLCIASRQQYSPLTSELHFEKSPLHHCFCPPEETDSSPSSRLAEWPIDRGTSVKGNQQHFPLFMPARTTINRVGKHWPGCRSALEGSNITTLSHATHRLRLPPTESGYSITPHHRQCVKTLELSAACC